MPNSETRALRCWLLIILTLVGLMVALGGITRLTGSGLSITEWKPIMGAIPPLNETDWAVAFVKYQQIPQFQLINSQMTLGEFKWIFFWEFTHRLLGRVIGLVFALPLLWFWIRKKIPAGYKTKFMLLFLLGGSQGAMGWFMVMSGLSELTSVSHIRLTLHLMLAFLIGAYALWLFKSLGEKSQALARETAAPLRRASRILFGLIFFQCVYGALTAGLKAGFQFPTFPTFQGEWFPSALFELSPWIKNWCSNPVTVQWVHRIVGTVVVIFSAVFAIKARPLLIGASANQRRASHVPAALSLMQYCFGVVLVLQGVPLWLGVTHQTFGFLLFLAGINAVYEFRRLF